MQLLDHGYLKVIEYWGSDERIVEAARMSTQKGFEGWGPHTPDCPARGNLAQIGCKCDQQYKGDEKLLKYLYNNQHSTPFEFAGCVIEVQAPIFVFREWHRHRTQSYNEASARYAPLPDLNYIPTVGRLMLLNSSNNKQAGTVSDAVELTERNGQIFQAYLSRHYINSQTLYEDALRMGVPKELARICLPVGRYSRMRASTCLRNWLSFMTLRSAPNAQHEIRVYSDALNDELAKLFPRTMALFNGEGTP